MSLEGVDGFRRNADACHAIFFGDALEEVLGEQGDVFEAFAEWGDGELDDIEAVEQVFAESTCADFHGEVFMGGGDDAHVGVEGFIGSDSGKRAILEDAQQFDLDREGHIADFVEEKSAAVGLFEASGAACDGAGEGAFFVAKELAFEEVFGDGTAIEGDHLVLAARAVLMDRLGDEFLAGAAFARDKHRRVSACDPPNQFEHILEGPRHADDLHPTFCPWRFRLRAIGAATVLVGLQGRFHNVPQLKGQ